MSDKCPKCGSVSKYKSRITEGDVMYECESWTWHDTGFEQSDYCRTIELTTQLAASLVEVERLRGEVESLINCPAKMDEALGRKYLQAITENEKLRHDAEKWRELTEASKLKAMVPQECDRCDGIGWHEGGMVLETTCQRCGGSGVIFPHPDQEASDAN